MNAKTKAGNNRKWDFSQTYEVLPQDGQFMKRTLAMVEKDPLLGETDRWRLATNLRRLDKGVTYPNGVAPKAHVRQVHSVISGMRKDSPEEALAQDPFIKQTILDNPHLPKETKNRLAQQAHKARQSQEYLTLGEEIDKGISEKVLKASMDYTQQNGRPISSFNKAGLLAWPNEMAPGPLNREILSAGNSIANRTDDGDQPREANATGTGQGEGRGWFTRQGNARGLDAEQRHWRREAEQGGRGNHPTSRAADESGERIESDAARLRRMEPQFDQQGEMQAEQEAERDVPTNPEQRRRHEAELHYTQQLAESTGEGANGEDAWWNGHPSEDDEHTIRIIICEGYGGGMGSRGHTAAMYGGRVFSFQEAIGVVEFDSLLEYLSTVGRNEHRDIKVVTLDVTPEQAQTILQEWKRPFVYGPSGTCTTRIYNSLLMAGVIDDRFEPLDYIPLMPGIPDWEKYFPGSFLRHLEQEEVITDSIYLLARSRDPEEDVTFYTADWE